MKPYWENEAFRSAVARDVMCAVREFAIDSSLPAENFQVSTVYWAKDLVCRLTHCVYSAGSGAEVVSFVVPATWWDALKERWFPRWALRRWPVCTRTLSRTVKVEALLPGIPVEIGKHKVVLHVLQEDA